jgi:hypothetical protein
MDSNADELRKRMSQVRENIDQDVGGLVQGAKSLVDWRGFVRRQPLFSLGIGIAAGYLLVPRRAKLGMGDPQGLARALARDGADVRTSGSVAPRSNLAGVSAPLAALALRMIANQVGRRATAAFVDRLQRGANDAQKSRRAASGSPGNAREGESTGNGRKS